jgi:hypothetical protein
MQHFMWDWQDDAFVWIANGVLERRTHLNAIIESVALPTSVEGTAVDWRGGHKNSIHNEGGLWIYGYNHPSQRQFILPIHTDPLSFDLAEGFWIDEVTGNPATERLFSRLSQKSGGFAIEPDGSRSTLQFDFQPGVDTTMSQIETAISTDDWKNPTWRNSLVAFWSNLNSRVEIHDASGLLARPKVTTIGASTLLHSLTVSDLATAYGQPTDNVTYTHGHLTQDRLAFSVYNATTNKYGVMIYYLSLDILAAVDVEFAAGLAFGDSVRPSLSNDGTWLAYLKAGEATLQNIVQPSLPVPPPPPPPGGEPPIPAPTPFPPVTRPPFFSWDVSMIREADWNNWRLTLPTDPTTGRPKPYNNNFRYPGSIGAGQIAATVNNEVPTMDADGQFYFNIFSSSHNGHNMLRSRSGSLRSGHWYLPRVLYRIDLEFYLDDFSGVGWSVPPTCIDWMIAYQIWGPFPESWRGLANPPPSRLSPPLAVRFGCLTPGTLQYELSTLGTSRTDPQAAWQHNETTRFNASTGLQRVSVWWKKDHTGGDSYVRIDVNGTKRHEFTNVKLGTPFKDDGSAVGSISESSGGTATWGMYTPQAFASPGVELRYSLVRMYRLN